MENAVTTSRAETTASMAYRALYVAAERIGARNWASGIGCRTYGGRRTYFPTRAHRDVVDAMPAVLAGSITPQDAMGLLWREDVAKERGI